MTNHPTAAQPIDLEPVARVDRIISASGLAEVSVFLESALKVGTVLYAAPVHAAEPAAPHAGGIVKEAILIGAHAEFSEAMPPLSLTSLGHHNVFKALRKAIQFYINHAKAPAAPHAPAGWREFIESCAQASGGMINGNFLSMKARDLLSAAPVPQEAEQAGDIELIRIPAHDADSYCRILSIIGMEEEGDPVAEVQRLFDAAQEAEQAATAAVTDLLLDVVRLTHDALENTEEDDDGLHWNRPDYDALSDAIDKLDALPDDQPGYVMGPAAKAAWAMRTQPAAPAVTDAACDVLADAKECAHCGRSPGDRCDECENCPAHPIEGIKP